MRLLRWILAVDCNQYVRSIGVRLSIGFIKPTPLERDRQSPFSLPLRWIETIKPLFHLPSTGVKLSKPFFAPAPLEISHQTTFSAFLCRSETVKLLLQPASRLRGENADTIIAV